MATKKRKPNKPPAAKKTPAVKKKASSKKGKPSAPETAEDFMAALALSYGGEATVSSLESELALPPVRERIPTGLLALDRVIGGGYPVGRFTEIAAWEGVGKSTLLDQGVAECQRMGGIGHIIDSEAARSPTYSSALGVDTSTCIIARCATLEEVFDYVDKVIVLQAQARAAGVDKPMLVVWDSLGATPSKEEFDGAADDRHVMVGPRVIRQNFRRICQKLADLRIALVFSNHFYKDLKGNLITPGGGGIRFFTSLRLWMTKVYGEDLKIGTRIVGHAVDVKVKKSRVSTPQVTARIGLLHGYGFHNAYTLYEWGIETANASGNPWVVNSGQWTYVYPPGEQGTTVHQKWLGLGELFRERPDVYEQMARQYLAEA